MDSIHLVWCIIERMKEFKSKISLDLPVSYFLRKKEGKELILLLHGFQDKASRLYQTLQSILPATSSLLAPNGLFPIPYKKEFQDGSPARLKLAYCWYFYDSFEKTYHIDQTPACNMIQTLIQQLFPKQDLSITIIGFSQGGYLAPFVGLTLPQTKKVIVINGEIKVDLLARKQIPFPIYSIHGKRDEMVDPQNCQRSFQQFLANGNQGEFDLLENSAHFIDEPIRERIVAQLNRSF